MTVLTTTAYFSNPGDGVTAAYGFPAAIAADTEIVVELIDIATGALTAQTLGLHYTVAIADDLQSGTVNFVTPPPATHNAVRRRNIDYLQPSRLRSHGPLFSDMVELAIDRVVKGLQALRDMSSRAVRFNASDPPSSAELPILSSILNKFIYVNSLGQLVGQSATSGVLPLTGTAADNVLIGLGAKSFATQADKSFNVGQWLTIASTASPANFMFGQVTTYNSVTGALVFNSQLVGGSGTFAAWSISASSVQGPPAADASVSGVRQAINAGPLSAAGVPTLLPATSVNLNLTTQNVDATHPLVIGAANGWSATAGGTVDARGYSIANLTWNGLTLNRAAATPNYLYVVNGANGIMTTGQTLLPPIDQEAGVPSATAGQFTFNRAEMKGYMGNGATAPQANIVFVGEAATNATTVISTVCYAYNGRYDSGFTNTLPAGATATSKNHNIGTYPENVGLTIECISADNGYAVGDRLVFGSYTASTSAAQYGPNALRSTAKTMVVATGDSAPWAAMQAPGGTLVALVLAKWKYKMTANRGW